MSGSVRISIAADSSQVINAFDRIRDAVRRAGQEGRQFSQIDFSHPELQKFEAEMKRIQQNFESMLRFSRGGTSSAVRRGGFNDFLDWFGNRDRIYPDPVGLQRHTAVAGRYILNGTGFQLPAAGAVVPGAPRGLSQEEAEDLRRRRMMQEMERGTAAGGPGLGAALGGPIKFILAAAGLGKMADMLGRGITDARDESMANDALMRHVRDVNTSFDELRTSVRQAAEGLQLTYGEAQRLSLAWTRLTNESSPDVLAYRMRYAVGFARGYGISPDAAVQTLGRATYLGQDEKRFAFLVGEAVKQGGMSGQVSEVMQALLHWSESASRVLVTHTDVGRFAALYAGMNATGMPGLRGAAGEALINRVNSAVMQGGAMGQASQVLFYNALARHGITNPYQQRYILSGGMFARVGNETAFSAIRDEIKRVYAGVNDPYRQYAAFGNVFGINPRQAQALWNLHAADLSHTQRYLSGLGLSLNQVDASSIPDIVAAAAPGANLDALRQRMLDRTGQGALTDAEKTRIQGESGENLRADLVRLMAAHGMEQTEGTKTRQSMADLTNALTKMGSGLLPVLNDLRTGGSRLAEVMSHLTRAVGDLDKYLHGDQKAGDELLNGEPEAQQALQQMDKQGGARVPWWMFGAPGRESAPWEANKRMAPGQREKNMAALRSYFLSKGYSPEQVAGLLANFDAESGFNPQASGDWGRAYGIGQWHPDRQAEFRMLFGHPIQKSTLQEQMEFAQWELTHTEKSAGDALRRAKTRYEAGFVVSQDYERPAFGAITAQHRGEMAATNDYKGSEERTVDRYKPLMDAFRDPEGTTAHPDLLSLVTAPMHHADKQLRAAAQPQQIHHTATVRVVHQTKDGHVLSEEHVPMHSAATPKPWGRYDHWVAMAEQ